MGKRCSHIERQAFWWNHNPIFLSFAWSGYSRLGAGTYRLRIRSLWLGRWWDLPIGVASTNGNADLWEKMQEVWSILPTSQTTTPWFWDYSPAYQSTKANAPWKNGMAGWRHLLHRKRFCRILRLWRMEAERWRAMVGNIHSRFAYCTSSACKIQNEENPQFQILEGAGLLCRTLFYLFGRNAYWGKEPVGGGQMVAPVWFECLWKVWVSMVRTLSLPGRC